MSALTSPMIDSLRAAWDAGTSSDPELWSPANPAWGQCAVTALVVQDEMGGDIVWARAELPDGRRISHYFNRVSGRELDLTREQFPPGTLIPAGIPRARDFASTRDYILSFPQTAARHARLLARLADAK